MATPIALLSADWHLARGAWATHPGIVGDAYYALWQLKRLAAKYDVQHFAAGDLFDTRWPAPCDLHVAFQLPCTFIQGDHDLRESPPGPFTDIPYLSLGNDEALHLHGKTTRLPNGAVVYGLDYRKPGLLLAALAAIPKEANILLAHQKWSDFLGPYGQDGPLSQVPDHIEQVWTGDYHAADIIALDALLREIAFDHHLRGDAGVIGAG